MRTAIILFAIVMLAGAAGAVPPPCPPYHACQSIEPINVDSDAAVFAQCFTYGVLVLEVEGVEYSARSRKLTQADRRVVYLPEGCTVSDRSRVR